MKNLFSILAIAVSATAFAQKNADAQPQPKAPDNWFNLSYANDHVHGVGTDRTYADLLKGLKPDTIIVAVIDGGVDYNHEDLKDVMWHNPGEIPGNGIDDDHNGFVDDVYGWNFLGNKNGKNVQYDNLELARIYRPLFMKFNGQPSSAIAPADKADYKKYLTLKDEYEKKVIEAKKEFQQISQIKHFNDALLSAIKKQRSVDSVMYSDFLAYTPDQKFQLYYNFVRKVTSDADSWNGFNSELSMGYDESYNMINYNLNLDYDPRDIIGDDYSNLNDHNYGNPDVKGPDPFHGTHVAGIIAANRFNNLGILGIASPVRIMAVRVVPDGDERDKDVANGIRYAVDNGAKIINMSFGKPYSPYKSAVDDAVKYAESKGVLLVHAAGNDNKLVDNTNDFPNNVYLTGGTASNWIEVGALSWRDGKYAAAPFSNYGEKYVDVFSPGVDIKSCKANGGYVSESGTSMASPVCAGVAAMLKCYYPNLTPAQIKTLIEQNSDKSLANTKVIMPGKKKKKKKFRKLSRTGGVVDLYAAFQAAGKMK